MGLAVGARLSVEFRRPPGKEQEALANDKRRGWWGHLPRRPVVSF